MSKLTRRFTKLVYRYGAKPVLFKIAPDAVHNHMVAAGIMTQRYGALRTLIRGSWAYRNDTWLAQTIHGTRFLTPIGLSAGFDKNIQLAPLMKAIGFGYMTGGSVTAKVCAGNSRPWFHRLPHLKSLAVHAGLGNDGSEVISRRIQGYDPAAFNDFPLFISVARTNEKDVVSQEASIEDFRTTLKRVANLSQFIEINISCPNAYGGEAFTTPDALESLLVAVDSLKLSQPVFVKMPAVTDGEFRALLDVIVSHKVAGVTICNLRKDRTGLAVSREIKGGLSGRPVFERSNNLIKLAYEGYGDRLIIIGVGGVFSAEDAYTKIRLGASLVSLITGMIYEGPQLIGDINAQLVRLLRADGFTNIQDIIGIDTRRRR